MILAKYGSYIMLLDYKKHILLTNFAYNSNNLLYCHKNAKSNP